MPKYRFQNGRLQRTLCVTRLEDRVNPAVLDLFTAGASGFLNSAKFEEVISTTSTGTGVFNSFVRIQASSNDSDGNPNTESGVNYDRAAGLKAQYDELTDPNSNRQLLLSEVPVVTVDGVQYREFFLDVNQLNNDPRLSLDSLFISVGNAGNLQQGSKVAPANYDPTFAGNATQVFNLDGNTDNTLRMLSDQLDNGSGKGDVRVLIPNSNFAGVNDATPYVYLFSRFGYTAPDSAGNSYTTNDGFEEWSVKTPENVATPKITVVKYTTYNGNEVDNQSIPEGSAIGWKYIATNSGNVPLTGVTVTDNVPGVTPVYQSGDANTNGIMEAGESWVYTASGTAQSAHLGTYTNLGTATGAYQTTTVTATDPSWYHPLNRLPGITIVKSASVPPELGEFGGNVTFTYTITSQSDPTDPLTLTSLVDDNGTPSNLGDDINLLLPGYYVSGDADSDGKVDSTETWVFRFTRYLAVNAGQTHTNAVVVNAIDDENTPVTADDTYVITAGNLDPTITVVKTGPLSINEGGAWVTYSYTVTSQSAVTDPLTILSFRDDNGTPGDTSDDFTPSYISGDTDLDGKIDWNETWTFTSDPQWVTLNAGQTHTNVVRITAQDDEGVSTSDDDDHTVTAVNVAPVVTIVKTGSATVNEGGDTATFTFTITNGSVVTDTITITALVDKQFGDLLAEAVAANGGNPIVLAPGGSFTFSISRTLTLNAGQTHTNVATVTARDDEGSADTDDDDHTVTGANVAPTVEIVKSGPATVAEGGADVTYTFVITAPATNASTDPLTITSVVDNVLGDLTAVAIAANGGNPIVLAPGASFTFTYDGQMPQSGTAVTNVVTVTGQDDKENPTTDTDTHTVMLTFTLSGKKHYDLNANGVNDGDPAISGWTIKLDRDGNLGTTGDQLVSTTDQFGGFSFSGLLPGTTYTLFEVLPSGWLQTYGPAAITSAVAADYPGQNFGNVKNAQTGGRTIGFWGNRNGLELLTQGHFLGLTDLNLVNANGSARDFTGTLAQNKSAFDTWLKNANATNMAYMLSAQLAATWLNVNVLNVSADTLIHLPALAAWAGNGQGGGLAGNLFGNGMWSVTGSLVRLGDVIDNANALLLSTGGNIPAGHPLRAYAEALKIVLDGTNNNLSIAFFGVGWNDANNNGVIDVGEWAGVW